MRANAKRVVTIASALALTAVAAGFAFHQLSPKAGNSLLAPVRTGDFAQIVRCRGEVRAGRSVDLTAPAGVSDLKLVWLADPGSSLKAGDVVVRFDRTDAERQLEQTGDALRNADAAFEQALAQAHIGAEKDKQELANVQFELERAKLEASRAAIVSVIQGEESELAVDSASARLRLERAVVSARVQSRSAQVSSARRSCEKARFDLERAKQRLLQMELRTPIAGIVSYGINYGRGGASAQPFRVGDQVWSGSLIAQIPDPSQLELESRIEETDRGKIAVGDSVRIRMDAFSEQAVEGRVSAISPLAELGSAWPPSRSFVVHIRTNEPDRRLRAGMAGTLDIVIDTIRRTAIVPVRSLFTENGKPVLYVFRTRSCQPVPVEVLGRNPDEAAVHGVAGETAICLSPPQQNEDQTRP